jgi:hypothetical protein
LGGRDEGGAAAGNRDGLGLRRGVAKDAGNRTGRWEVFSNKTLRLEEHSLDKRLKSRCQIKIT